MIVEIKVSSMTAHEPGNWANVISDDWWARTMSLSSQLPLTTNNFDPINGTLEAPPNVGQITIENALYIFKQVAQASFPLAEILVTY